MPDHGRCHASRRRARHARLDYAHARGRKLAADSRNLRVCDVVCEFATTKHVAAICAAPFILGELDLLEGRHATCFPGFEKSFPEGAYTGDKVTHDGNIITASGMAQSLPFALELLRTLAGDKAVEKVAEGIQL